MSKRPMRGVFPGFGGNCVMLRARECIIREVRISNVPLWRHWRLTCTPFAFETRPSQKRAHGRAVKGSFENVPRARARALKKKVQKPPAGGTHGGGLKVTPFSNLDRKVSFDFFACSSPNFWVSWPAFPTGGRMKRFLRFLRGHKKETRADAF